ncbi:MAG: EAL domain-containing protein, partial [Lachnospiraceae bacterium]|nr:EAL domain-containing protein [Lachnospiraceae bacterium]
AIEIGLSVITEGVETEEQKEFLEECGCRNFQGYYFSKPIPVSEFEEKYLKADR